MNAKENRTPLGEIAATRIIANWKGGFVADACIAATQIGLLHSGNMLGYDRAKTILRLNFEANKVDDIHWSTVYGAFQNARTAVISNIELRNRYQPAAANDNNTHRPAPASERAATTAFSQPGNPTRSCRTSHGRAMKRSSSRR